MADKNDKTGAMQVDIELVRQLAAVLDETNLTEIEVEDADRKVRATRTLRSASSTSISVRLVSSSTAASWRTSSISTCMAPVLSFLSAI